MNGDRCAPPGSACSIVSAPAQGWVTGSLKGAQPWSSRGGACVREQRSSTVARSTPRRPMTPGLDPNRHAGRSSTTPTATPGRSEVRSALMDALEQAFEHRELHALLPDARVVRQHGGRRAGVLLRAWRRRDSSTKATPARARRIATNVCPTVAGRQRRVAAGGGDRVTLDQVRDDDKRTGRRRETIELAPGRAEVLGGAPGARGVDLPLPTRPVARDLGRSQQRPTAGPRDHARASAVSPQRLDRRGAGSEEKRLLDSFIDALASAAAPRPPWRPPRSPAGHHAALPGGTTGCGHPAERASGPDREGDWRLPTGVNRMPAAAATCAGPATAACCGWRAAAGVRSRAEVLACRSTWPSESGGQAGAACIAWSSKVDSRGGGVGGPASGYSEALERALAIAAAGAAASAG